MKIYALNASPRKQWNSDQMLDSFLKGLRAAGPDIAIEKIHIYDMDFKGCRGCGACHLKNTEDGHCLFPDNGTELIRSIKSSDGLVFASPVYYFDVPAQMRAVLERLFYPGPGEHEIPVTAIYTMNQKQPNMEKYFKHHLDDIAFFFRKEFQTEPEELYAYNTLHWKNPDKCQFPIERYEDKVAYKKEHFENDLQSACDAGVRFAEKVCALTTSRAYA